MKKIIILLVIMVSSLIPIVAADPVTSVSQQPPDIAINDTFIAEVTVDPVDGEIYAASYRLYFNSTILKAIEQTQGDFLSQGGAEMYEVVNEINNTIGKIQYGEIRLGTPETVGGATTHGVLASITFTVIGEGVGALTLSNVKFDDLNTVTVDPPQKPFLIYGCVCYDNGSLCSNPGVSITNLNTSEEWTARTSDSYYQITPTSGIDLNATEILRFNVIDGIKSNVTDHTITTDDVNAGGLFNFNLTIASLKMGDVNGDGDITSADAAITLQMAVRGEYYEIADASGDDRVTSLDALMIQQAAIDQITI